MASKAIFAPITLAFILSVSLSGLSKTASADSAGAFIGGVFATKLLGNMEARTEAEQAQAAAAQRAVPAAPAQKSPEQRIAELDKLAAGGYITPEEYKAKKQKILDGI